MINQSHSLRKSSRPGSLNSEYSRLLTAAVINANFREMLLSNPGKALANGYGGEAFNLVSEERKHIASIHATSLADFAKQLSQMPYSTGVLASD